MRVNNVLLNTAKRAGFNSKVEIVSQQAAADTDYQVKVEDIISRKGDGEDITFFQKNAILHHWLESYTSWRSEAWTKLPTLPVTKSQILNILSGNPSASNGDSTFLVGDDFASDITGWTKYSGAGSIEWDSGGYLKATSFVRAAHSTIVSNGVYSMEARIQSVGGATEMTGVDFLYKSDNANPDANDLLAGYMRELTTKDAQIEFWGGINLWGNDMDNAIVDDVWYRVSHQLKQTDAEFKVIRESDQAVIHQSTHDVTHYDESVWVGVTASDPGYALFDWIFLRKLASPEPLAIIRKIFGKSGITKAVCGGICP